MGEAQFGVRPVIGASATVMRFSEQVIVALPPRTAKFTLAEWRVSNDQRCRNTEDQQQLADRILGECNSTREECEERAMMMQVTIERRLEERIGDVNFNKTELEIQRKEVCLELEALSVYKVRIQDCLGSLQTNALNVVKKCLMLRDGRVGIDLVVDDVEAALHQEIETIIGGQNVLKRLLEQLQEQMRRLRSTRYTLDRDLQYKQSAIDIDKCNLSLKHTNLYHLSIYKGHTTLDPAKISSDEYNAYSAKNIRDAAREVTSARPIRMYVDTLLKQVIEDLWSAYRKTNHEISERIKDTRRTKSKLEDMHRETSKLIADIQLNIILLKKVLSDKEGHAGLGHKLGKRAQRVGAELVRDPAAQSLLYEGELISRSVEQLQQMLYEATASLRYLNQIQIQLEEDINVKINTLKIDEVDCMTLRGTIDYHVH